MSQFDQTTEKIIESMQYSGADSDQRALRNSAKASMEMLARALERFSPFGRPTNEDYTARANAINQVKANGDWPLED